jgi:hypothetical protein
MSASALELSGSGIVLDDRRPIGYYEVGADTVIRVKGKKRFGQRGVKYSWHGEIRRIHMNQNSTIAALRKEIA